MKEKLKLSLAILTLAATICVAQAQDATIRLHHFMSTKANLHTNFLVPFSERLAEKSDGRIKLEIFDSMSLGGRPNDLYDQAVDGAVDIILTLPGYTPGRFNKTEAFELPFIMEDPVSTSKAFWELVDNDLQNGEYGDVQILAAWVHGPGVIHSKDPIEKLEDLKDKEIRGPTRLVTDLLGELGAKPVGMPLPAIPENLSKGVINGAVIPWEIAPAIRVPEMVKNHTELSGPKSLYTATLILAMNQDSYDDLPDDLRSILDMETKKTMSELAGQIMIGYDAQARKTAQGNNIIVLDENEVERWVKASQPVYDRFIERAKEEGFNGEELIKKVKALITANQ